MSTTLPTSPPAHLTSPTGSGTARLARSGVVAIARNLQYVDAKDAVSRLQAAARSLSLGLDAINAMSDASYRERRAAQKDTMATARALLEQAAPLVDKAREKARAAAHELQDLYNACANRNTEGWVQRERLARRVRELEDMQPAQQVAALADAERRRDVPALLAHGVVSVAGQTALLRVLRPGAVEQLQRDVADANAVAEAFVVLKTGFDLLGQDTDAWHEGRKAQSGDMLNVANVASSIGAKTAARGDLPEWMTAPTEAPAAATGGATGGQP